MRIKMKKPHRMKTGDGCWLDVRPMGFRNTSDVVALLRDPETGATPDQNDPRTMWMLMRACVVAFGEFALAEEDGADPVALQMPENKQEWKVPTLEEFQRGEHLQDGLDEVIDMLSGSEVGELSNYINHGGAAARAGANLGNSSKPSTESD